MLSDNSIPGAAASGPLPTGAVSPRTALRRSRIGLWVPTLGTPVIFAACALLVAFAHAPPGIGIAAFFWGLGQSILLGGPTRAKSGRHPARLDPDQLLLTGRTWTGTRTISLAKLARVSRVKWTFSGEYAATRTVDYVICTDSTGARLAVSRYAAAGPVREALAYQRQHNLPAARVSRFTAIGLGLAEDSIRFRLVRALAVIGAVLCYVALGAWLIVVAIPALAPAH